MKKKLKFKSILTFILSIIIVISVFPTTVFGATNNYARIDYEVYYNSSGRTIGTLYTGDSFYNSNIKLNTVNKLVFEFYPTANIQENEKVDFSIILNSPQFVSCTAFITDLNYVLDGSGRRIGLDFDKKTNSFSGSYVYKNGYENIIVFAIENPVFQNPNDSLSVSFTTFKYIVNSEESNFFGDVKEWFKNLFELLTAKFGALGDGISNLTSKLTSSFTDLKNNMSNFFDGLGDRISGFFTNLSNDIKSRFTDLKNSLQGFFNNVGDWFASLGDNISSFFEKLWNRIYWGNENGQSEYQKPVINNKLNDIIDTLDGYQLQLKDTIDTIGNSAEQVSTYISTGTSFVNGIINVAGVGFTALIVFGIVFVLVRKVVGR